MKDQDLVEEFGLSYQTGAYWVFIVSSDAVSCETQRKEMINICGQIFNSFEGFYTPNLIEHNTQTYEREADTPFRGGEMNQSASRNAPNDNLKIELRSSGGITFSELVGSFPARSNPHRRITYVNFSSGTTTMQVDSRAVPVGGYELEDEPAGFDPLQIIVYTDYNFPRPSLSELGIDRANWIHVITHSQIWFEESKVGQKNRASLEESFERLVTNLDVVFIEYDREDGPRRELYLD